MNLMRNILEYKMSKFTPGPWHINAYNKAEVIVIRDGAAPDGKTYIDGRHQERVAMVGTDNTATWGERYANAKIIAAAPLMYDALERLINTIPTEVWEALDQHTQDLAMKAFTGATS